MKTKKNKELNCSSAKTLKKGYSCYNDKELLELRKYWNIRHPDVEIKSKEPRKIWNSLKKNMSGVCSTEKCWLKQQFMKNKMGKELLKYTFSPNAPPSWRKNPREWLNSLDLENIMKQYERYNKNFLFLGPSPIDFDTHMLNKECVWEELCKFSLEKILKKNKNKIGIIFNLDPHYKSGSHWVSMFINIGKNYIFYFDSNGDTAPKEVKVLAERIKEQGRKLNINLKYIENHPVEHQQENTECGIYSIYMITSILENTKKVEDFTSKNKKPITDDEMFNLRKKYFNTK